MTFIHSLTAVAAMGTSLISLSFAAAASDLMPEDMACSASDAGCDDVAMLQVSRRGGGSWPQLPFVKIPEINLPSSGVNLPGIYLPQDPAEMMASVQNMDLGGIMNLQQELDQKLDAGGGVAEGTLKALVDKLADGSAEQTPAMPVPQIKLPEIGNSIPGIELPTSPSQTMAKVENMDMSELHDLQGKLDAFLHQASQGQLADQVQQNLERDSGDHESQGQLEGEVQEHRDGVSGHRESQEQLEDEAQESLNRDSGHHEQFVDEVHEHLEGHSKHQESQGQLADEVQKNLERDSGGHESQGQLADEVQENLDGESEGKQNHPGVARQGASHGAFKGGVQGALQGQPDSAAVIGASSLKGLVDTLMGIQKPSSGSSLGSMLGDKILGSYGSVGSFGSYSLAATGEKEDFPSFHMPHFSIPDFHLPETGIDLPGVELPKSPSELKAAVEKMDTGKLKELQQKLDEQLKAGGGVAESSLKSFVDQMILRKQ